MSHGQYTDFNDTVIVKSVPKNKYNSSLTNPQIISTYTIKYYVKLNKICVRLLYTLGMKYFQNHDVYKCKSSHIL